MDEIEHIYCVSMFMYKPVSDILRALIHSYFSYHHSRFFINVPIQYNHLFYTLNSKTCIFHGEVKNRFSEWASDILARLIIDLCGIMLSVSCPQEEVSMSFVSYIA